MFSKRWSNLDSVCHGSGAELHYFFTKNGSVMIPEFRA